MGKGRARKGRKRPRPKPNDAADPASGEDSPVDSQASPKPKVRANPTRSRSERSVRSNSSEGSESVCSESMYSISEDEEPQPGPSGNKKQPRVAKKPPPIMVKHASLDMLLRETEKSKVDATFQICRIGVKIIPATKRDHEAAIGFLQGTQLQYYTHDHKEDKPFKAVVKGLPLMDPKTIMGELSSRYKLKPLAVFPMRRKEEAERDQRDRFYLVHFEKGSITTGALQAVRVIGKIRCRWEPYRSNRHDTQCQRCLDFGHGTRNCRCKPRCAVCAKNHLTSDCLEQEDAAVKCANCKGEHRGNDRTCPKRKEWQVIRQKAAEANQPRKNKKKKEETRPPVPAMDKVNFPGLPGTSTAVFPAAGTRGGTSNEFNVAGNLAGPAGAPKCNCVCSCAAKTNKLSVWTKPVVAVNTSDSPEMEPVAAEEESLPDKYTAEKLMTIFEEMVTALGRCSDRKEQIRVLGQFVIQYGC